MDTKTKIQIIVSLGLVTLIGALTYWIQLPADDLKAQLLTEEQTVLVRIKDFEYTPDIVRIEKGTVVSWLNDETEANAGVQHTVISYDPEDTTKSGDVFESDLLSQGDTFTFKFEEDGVFNYNCSLHPFMLGKVCVGDASEDADPDCVTDETQAEETLGGDEETLDDDTTDTDDTLPPTEEIEEDENLPPTENIDEETTDEELAALTEDLNEDLMDLSGAADEDYVSITTTDTTTTAAPVYTSSQQYQETNLSKSGPEDYIYIFLAIIAVLAARKVTKRQKRSLEI
jgi:plastocyanin